MATILEDSDIRAAYTGPFREALEGRWKEWKARYWAYLTELEAIKGDSWLSPQVQQRLWESDAVTSIGPGRSVTVEGAYTDTNIAQRIRQIRETPLSAIAQERGIALQAHYDWLLEAVAHYNERQPKARIRRLLASLCPKDMTCIVDGRRIRQVTKVVGLSVPRGTGAVTRHPLLLERLRKALGEPRNLEDVVSQSMYSWFLWETYCDQPEDGSIAIKPSTATDLPSLSILPAGVQRRGLSYVRQNVDLLVAVVREAEQGITRPDLIAVIQREAPHLKAAGSAVTTISQAQGGLGLIGLRDGAYRPTEDGQELLTASDPREVLQPLLINRVFGVGQLLLALKKKPGGTPQKEIATYIAGLYPTRKSLWAGNELIQWGLATDLLWRKDSFIGLTEDGLSYADALPVDFLDRWRFDAPTDPVDDEAEADVSSSEPGVDEVLKAAAFQDIRTAFTEGAVFSRLVLGDGLLLELHAALHASKHKRFVLLAGLSGTGKTSITAAYAEAYCKALGIADWSRHYLQVAVRPDWTDPTGLLGFVNTLSDPPSYRPAETLNFLMEADRDRARPYFLCLDEMNLARVEHYFAPFLSAMESPRARLRIHGEGTAVDNVEPTIRWPQNIFFFGTVNMDESTHPFSDKVLDRAFTFEFWDVDLAQWEQRRHGNTPASVLDRVTPLLKALYSALYPARRHFGYRTADEFLDFCIAAGDAPPSDALIDAAIFMKVLPRVRGDDSGPLTVALKAIAELVKPFPRTLLKVQQMQEDLAISGQARFWS